eukprot:SAG22_NODE_19692_length_272_cov_0.901734_1_plen_42_part_10
MLSVSAVYVSGVLCEEEICCWCCCCLRSHGVLKLVPQCRGLA